MRLRLHAGIPAPSKVLVAAALASVASAQYTVDNSWIPSGSPANNSSSENVDFADVDLDGDWDAAFADGGDDGNDQNRLWINQGGLQSGTLGVFVDETSARFPSISDQSRDIEFVDFEGDGDADIYVSNTSAISNQGNRWWTNQGGAQGASAGYFVDETQARWVGLGGPGSSIAANQVLSDSFIDWSCDCDFGDLDNDGDLDLVHSSYGGAFGGLVPTRLFLNDGDGFFEEFNPSGYQLPIATITNGVPGIWCDGNQSANTSNSTGASCDIASSALDIDVGDIDGDFDLDILHGARQEAPRMFVNRLEGSALAPAVGGGALGFRDVSTAVFPGGWSSGNGHYEQEMGDLDGDGDLDIYGLNWQVNFGFQFNDITLRNDGSGSFSNLTVLSGSTADDNEGDFVDYDNDGDLDLYVANFSGGDKLYRNNNNGGSSFSFTQVSAPSFGAISLDADACDTDGDGDYDILVAEDNGQANTFLRNTTNTPDTTAPYIPNVEALGNQPAAAGTRAFRAHVYDNAPYYITWYNPTRAEVEVDGVLLPERPMVSSAGQVFRGTLPGHLVGTVDYRVVSEDEYGNTGNSAWMSYTSTGSTGTSYGATTAGSLGAPTLRALSLALAGEELYLAAGNMPPGTAGFLALSTSTTPSSIDLSNGLLLQVGLPILLLAPVVADANGDAVVVVTLPSFSSGLGLAAQAVSVDGTAGNAFATSQGLSLSIP